MRARSLARFFLLEKNMPDVQRAFRGVSANSMEARLIQDVQGLQKLWDDALVSAMENVRRAQEGTTQISSETQRAIENDQTVTGDVEIKHSGRYDYDTLISKPDIAIVQLTNAGNLSADSAVSQGRKNVLQYAGRYDNHGTPMIHVVDLGKYVSVGNKALKHGLGGRRTKLQATVVANIGDILKNSVVVNEANPKKSGQTTSWILLSAAKDEDGNTIFVRSVVNQSNGHLEDVSAFYSAYGKMVKKGTSRNLSAERVTANADRPSSGSVISIAEMLRQVNGVFDDVISKNVADRLGITRSTSEFTPNLRYSPRTNTPSDRDLLRRATAEDGRNSTEQEFISEYIKRTDELIARQEELEGIRTEIRRMQNMPRRDVQQDKEYLAKLNRMILLLFLFAFSSITKKLLHYLRFVCYNNTRMIYMRNVRILPGNGRGR